MGNRAVNMQIEQCLAVLSVKREMGGAVRVSVGVMGLRDAPLRKRQLRTE